MAATDFVDDVKAIEVLKVFIQIILPEIAEVFDLAMLAGEEEILGVPAERALVDEGHIA